MALRPGSRRSAPLAAGDTPFTPQTTVTRTPGPTAAQSCGLGAEGAEAGAAAGGAQVRVGRDNTAVTAEAPPSLSSGFPYWLLISSLPAPAPLGSGASSLRFAEQRRVPGQRLVQSTVTQAQKVLPVPTPVGTGKFRLLEPVLRWWWQGLAPATVSTATASPRPPLTGGDRPLLQRARCVRLG